jgi:hypothetical protein
MWMPSNMTIEEPHVKAKYLVYSLLRMLLYIVYVGEPKFWPKKIRNLNLQSKVYQAVQVNLTSYLFFNTWNDYRRILPAKPTKKCGNTHFYCQRYLAHEF